MPIFNAHDPLAIPQLFQHQFDIDDLIATLCGPAPQWLNTTNGTLSPAEPTVPSSHKFLLAPLPASFVAGLATSPELRLLEPADQAALQALLPTLMVGGLTPQFKAETRLGGWLRERVKEAALEWLDAHNLIPPSMRHINRRTAPAVKGATITIA
jgi:hypothetical protein